MLKQRRRLIGNRRKNRLWKQSGGVHLLARKGSQQARRKKKKIRAKPDRRLKLIRERKRDKAMSH